VPGGWAGTPMIIRLCRRLYEVLATAMTSLPATTRHTVCSKRSTLLPCSSVVGVTALAFVNLKPGTGKTTSAVLLSAALHAHSRRVLLVDADPGASALRWSDLAGGFPFAIAGLAKRTILRDLVTLVARTDVDHVVIDTPQLEDHAAIAHGAMSYADHWVVPLAPAGIEVDRMTGVADHMDQVDAVRTTPADRMVLLTRTNRPWATRTGPDADVRQVLTDRGYDVLTTQVPHHDGLYRQTFGTPLDFIDETAFPRLADELLAHAVRVMA
jgi:chromosome partitioning protein